MKWPKATSLILSLKSQEITSDKNLELTLEVILSEIILFLFDWAPSPSNSLPSTIKTNSSLVKFMRLLTSFFKANIFSQMVS
jgi:hypothetical protein